MILGCRVTSDRRPRPCRVLALDGGGIKGAFTASVLHELEIMTGRSIARSFDLVVGTSTGGIMALGIGLGLDLQDIVSLYTEKGSKIFPPSPRLMFAGCLRGLFRAKFRPAGLQTELEAAFGARLLGESRCRLVVTAFNADDGDVKLFKTAHHERFRRDYKLRVLDVALATSAAPTYFPAHQIEGDLALVDGGVWANCPALVGVVEAITILGFDRTDIDVLSIGTTDEPFDIPRELRVGGKLRWACRAPTTLMRASEVASVAQAELLTRRTQRGDGLLRLNPPTRPKRFQMDSPAEVSGLVALGRKTAEHRAEEIAQRFMCEPTKPFSPAHRLFATEKQ